MNEKQIATIFLYIHFIKLGLVLIAAFLYALPLCFIRQFHKPLHLLTLNVCIAEFMCSTYWMIYYIMNAYYPLILWTPQSCLLILYLQQFVICQVFYGICIVSLNRLLTIVYRNKALFRTKRWVGICVGVQLMLGALAPLPILFLNAHRCLIFGLESNYRIYVIFIAIIIPAIFLAATNSIIFTYSRRSTQRVQPTNGNSAQAATLSHRDAYLLKHMLFIFTVFWVTWTPAYIIMAILGYGISVSTIIVQVLFMLPSLGQLVDIGDLFFYNHELRKYLSNQRQHDQTNPPRE